MFIFTVVMVITTAGQSEVRSVHDVSTNLMMRDGLRDWSKNSVASSESVFW